jgi:hypothetical protein
MRKNNALIESISTTIGTIIVLLFGSTIILGLVWFIVWLIKSIAGM